MTATTTIAALSPQATTVALLVPSSTPQVRVQLYSVASGSLQTTLSSTAPPSNGDAAAAVKVQQLIFSSEHQVAALTASQLIVWNLQRGVVEYTIDSPESYQWKRIVCQSQAQAQHPEGSLGETYLWSTLHNNDSNNNNNKNKKQRSILWVYQHQTLIRKVKLGKHVLAVDVCDQHQIVVRRPETLQWLDINTGSKMGAAVPLATTTTNHHHHHTASPVVLAGTDWAMTTVNETTVECYSVEGHLLHQWKDCTVTMKDSSGVVAPRLLLQLVQTEPHTVVLWGNHQLLLGTDDNPPRVQEIVTPLDTIVLAQQGILVAVMLPQGSEPLQIGSTTQLTSVTFARKNNNDNTNTTMTTKRKMTTSILGPAQAGGEASVRDLALEEPHAKRSKGSDDDDDNGPTIAERLAQLQQALKEQDEHDDDDRDEVAAGTSSTTVPQFQPKRATTESLTQVLQQALQSGDDALLELALAVHDTAVMTQTCAQLSTDHLLVLWTALTARLASKPTRANELCGWLMTLLQTGRIRSVAHLQPFQNLLQERLQVFPDLLKLEGRLHMSSL